jgi:rhodanese-related sulfurtransferase
MALREVAEGRLLELDLIARRLEEATEGIQALTAGELADQLRDREMLVIDLRPREEYEAAHIPGAVSIPGPELGDRIDELPRDKTIVAYCRGPYCATAANAVTMLQDRGYDVIRLEDSVLDWQALGMPVVAGMAEEA